MEKILPLSTGKAITHKTLHNAFLLLDVIEIKNN